MAFYVYIVANRRNGTLYIGRTDNIGLRAYEHRQGLRPGFASKYSCNRLVWYEMHDTGEAAFTRERRLKGWRRAWKISLIEALNPGWRDLTDDINTTMPPSRAAPLTSQDAYSTGVRP